MSNDVWSLDHGFDSWHFQILRFFFFIVVGTEDVENCHKRKIGQLLKGRLVGLINRVDIRLHGPHYPAVLISVSLLQKSS